MFTRAQGDFVSVIAVALEHMLAAGMPHAAIVEAVRAMEAEVRDKPMPRSGDAYKQRRNLSNEEWDAWIDGESVQ